jgi:hypothetical protein
MAASAFPSNHSLKCDRVLYCSAVKTLQRQLPLMQLRKVRVAAREAGKDVELACFDLIELLRRQLMLLPSLDVGVWEARGPAEDGTSNSFMHGRIARSSPLYAAQSRLTARDGKVRAIWQLDLVRSTLLSRVRPCCALRP